MKSEYIYSFLIALSFCIGLLFYPRNTKITNTVKVSVTPTLTSIPTPTPYSFSQDRLFDLVQSWRKEQGLTEYVKDERLCKIATDRSDDKFSHDLFAIQFETYPYQISENLALYKGSSEQQVLSAWLNSKLHHTILKIPYKASCIICKDQCVQISSNLDL